MIDLTAHSVRFVAGWNAASLGLALSADASDEAQDGYNEYFIKYFPPIPPIKTSDGCNSESSKRNRLIHTKQTYLNYGSKHVIK